MEQKITFHNNINIIKNELIFSGLIISGNEISQILLSLILSYAGGQRNRPRWIAWGVVFCSLSCFILVLPHAIYGAGDDVLQLTKEYVTQNANITEFMVGPFLIYKEKKQIHIITMFLFHLAHI